jgi:MFS family permease
MSDQSVENRQNLTHNYIVNVIDGGFFGLGLGFASFTTILPLFFATLTDSAMLIGLIPAFHTMGWQLPQLFTARRIARLPRYKPFVLLITIHERIPFLGLALIAWLPTRIDTSLALGIALVFLLWQGLGGGFTANAWQNMVGKVIPSEYLATFFGMQSSAANLAAAGGAIAAGIILERIATPYNFAINFLLGGIFMLISMGFLALTRESARFIDPIKMKHPPLWKTTAAVLKKDSNFSNFLAARILSQFGMMAFAFYTIFAVKYHGMGPALAGVMTSVIFFTQVIANPLLGRLADRWSRKGILEIGSVAIIISALLAWLAPTLNWFYLVFILTGIANTAFWTISLAITLDFGEEEERPTYVGMANTLIAPSAIIAPFLGGWLADTAGYQYTFIAAAIAGLFTALILHFMVRDPKLKVLKKGHEDIAQT